MALHVPSDLVDYSSALNLTKGNIRTGFIVLNPLLELERVELHVHPGRSRSDGSSTITSVLGIDKVSALGSDDLGLALTSYMKNRKLHRHSRLPERSIR
jgi:hypothetical protein